MINFYNVFNEVSRILFSGILVIVIFSAAKSYGKEPDTTTDKKNWIQKSRWWKYLVILCLTALIGFSYGRTYGTHMEDSDYYRDGDVIVDFNATQEQRDEAGLTTFFVLVIPAMIGVYKGKKETN